MFSNKFHVRQTDRWLNTNFVYVLVSTVTEILQCCFISSSYTSWIVGLLRPFHEFLSKNWFLRLFLGQPQFFPSRRLDSSHFADAFLCFTSTCSSFLHNRLYLRYILDLQHFPCINVPLMHQSPINALKTFVLFPNVGRLCY
jgi:hypothetical protein